MEYFFLLLVEGRYGRECFKALLIMRFHFFFFEPSFKKVYYFIRANLWVVALVVVGHLKSMRDQDDCDLEFKSSYLEQLVKVVVFKVIFIPSQNFNPVVKSLRGGIQKPPPKLIPGFLCLVFTLTCEL